MKFLSILQAIVGIILIILILLQRGSGGFLEETSIVFQRRGFEKFLFQATIFTTCLFFLLAILNFLI